MYSLSELQAQLSAFHARLVEAIEHTNRAAELLDEARETIVTAFAQAELWLPPELAAAQDRLRADIARLGTAGELVSGYQARL